MLYMIGLGLDDREITEKGIEALESVDRAYAEFYTNTDNIDLERLEEETGTLVEEVNRDQVEKQDLIIERAEESDIAFLVSGDPLTATTHYDIRHRAEQRGIEVRVIHAPSIMTSVAETGLNLYSFGRTVTLPEGSAPGSVAEHIEKNDSVDLHTLVLLDIDYPADEAASKLIELGVNADREAVVLARANHQKQQVTVDSLESITESDFGDTPHSIVLTRDLDHKEQEFLEAHR